MSFVVYTCDLIQKKYKFTITGSSEGPAMKAVEKEVSYVDALLRQRYRRRTALTDPLRIAQDIEFRLRGIPGMILDRYTVDNVTLEKFSLPSFLPDVFVDDQLSIPTRS